VEAAPIRDASASDLARIVEIYNAAVPGRMATADTEPVSLESRLAWFREHDPARHPLWVLEQDGRIAGWLSFGAFYGRPAYAGTCELSVYVAPEAQRRGVARTLVARALERAPALGFEVLLGFIFAHNEPSLALFRGFGFESWAHLPRVAVLDGVKRDLLILGREAKGRP
jgi:phosphinothricin acetyltransferase